MTPLVRARSLSHSGTIRPTSNAFARSAAQPTVALVSARRSYWHARACKANDHMGGAYSYMMAYPKRSLPHYVRHMDSLQYAYMDSLARNRVQTSRNSSNWSPEDRHTHGSSGKSNESPRQETPWETRTRLASERYLLLVEEHMALLKKDPYWGLFGSSELRGVWNPWRNSGPLRKRVDERTWKAWEESQKAAENLRRAVRGETSKEHGNSTQTNKVEVTQTSTPQQLVWSMQDDEYVYDPVSNKRVRRSLPSDHAHTIGSQARPSPSPASATDHTEEVSIPVTKYRSSMLPENSNTSAEPAKVISVYTAPGSVALTGFAQWLNQDPPLNLSKPAVRSTPTNNNTSAFAKSRLVHVRRIVRNEARERSERLSQSQHLQTSLERRSQANSNLDYAETVDRRENLDFLRPDGVRASMARAAASNPSNPTVATSERWAALEAAAVKAFQTRENRVSKELAASKWSLKRNWSAYPGDIVRTPEELRARRQILEHSFTNSVDLIELEVAKALGKVIVPADAFQKISATPSADDRLVAQRRVDVETSSKKAQLQAKVALLLQKEIGDQKAAMTAAVRGIRAHKAAQAEELAKQASKAPTLPALSDNQATRPSAQISNPPQANDGFRSDQSKIRPAASKSPVNQIGGDAGIRTSGIGNAGPALRDALPYRESGTKMAPSGGAQELDSLKQFLDAAVCDFEQILSQESGKTTEPSEPNVKGNSKASSTAKEPQVFEKRIYPKHAPSTLQADVDNLTAKLAEIANQAPTTPTSATVTSSHTDVAPANSYILLAYDKRERKLRMTRTSSGLHEASAPKRTVDSIMSRLVEPSAYFEYMERLEKAGYELVAGGHQMLVYKDVLKRKLSPTALGDGTITSSPPRGWGSPEIAQTKPPSAKAPGKIPSRPVRRVEESFSGVPPRLESERITEEIDQSQQRRSGPVWKVAKGVLILGTVFYFFGVTLEWLKLREKRRLVEEYQQEVRRVQELERARALEHTKGSGWGFS